MQHLPSEAGHPVEEDGLFGQATPEAVKRFQRRHGLRPGRNRRPPHVVGARERDARARYKSMILKAGRVDDVLDAAPGFGATFA